MKVRANHLPGPVRRLARPAVNTVCNRWTPAALQWRCRLAEGRCAFDFGGETYRYFWPLNAAARRSERAVELPIAWARVQRADPARTLEIGNVLSNFFPVRHLVLDKYERVPGVINEDVADFSPAGRYNLIISISTLEHVGWDPPEPRDPTKILRAIDNLRSHLTQDGELFVTFPHGWNTELDGWVSVVPIPFTERRCLKRVSADDRWVEVDCEELEEVGYGSPFDYANGITVGTIRRP